jgi:glycosyltransferase involved in cell wall biosynthesis
MVPISGENTRAHVRSSATRLTILLPVRNAEASLSDWLTSVGSIADAVIALDDGSTDATRSILEAHPLVVDVLTNPVRSGYEGWDDLGNRQRLGARAVELGDSWLLFLDADERLHPEDAIALRSFIETDARPGFAYGFEVFRMVDDDQHVDLRSLWAFRLFSSADAHEPLGSQRLHFSPVPAGIPRRQWLFTSLRIQHFGSLTSEHRTARFEKYLAADPDNEHQYDYRGLLLDPVHVHTWPLRQPNVPVLLGVEGRYADRHIPGSASTAGGGPLGDPVVSAVVIAQNDREVIDACIEALLCQEMDEPFEVIVVCSGSDTTAQRVRERFPDVRCVQLPFPVLPGEARNIGLWMARGEYITFPGSHVRLLPGALAARVAAHDAGWKLVTTAVVNGNDTPAGWASYFVDHAAQVPTRPSGRFNGVPGHASYVTHDLRQFGGFPQDMRAGEDTVINRRLYFAGRRAWFCAESAFVHTSRARKPAQFLRHHFGRGQGHGRILRDEAELRTMDRARVAVRTGIVRLRALKVDAALLDEDLSGRYRSVRVLAIAGLVAFTAGTFLVIARGSRRRRGGAAEANQYLQRVTMDAPFLVVSGRPGDAADGLLSLGNSEQATEHLLTLARYATSTQPVRCALAPLVTSATVTAEAEGTYTIDLPDEVVGEYVRTARSVGAETLLQIQPGRATLDAVLERWNGFLSQPGVGLFLDLRPEVAGLMRRDEELLCVVRALRSSKPDAVVFVRGVADPPAGILAVEHLLNLRVPGTPLPHEAFGVGLAPQTIVYH